MLGEMTKWLNLDAFGGSTPVFTVRQATGPEGEVTDASYDHTENRIEITDGPADLQKHRLFHETTHRAFGNVGIELLAKVFKCTEDKDEIEKREELIVSFLDVTLYDILTRNGWLRIPDPPKLGGSSSDGGKKRGTCKDPRVGIQTKTSKSGKRSRAAKASRKRRAGSAGPKTRSGGA